MNKLTGNQHLMPGLRVHQQEACVNTLAELEITDRCKVIMACGTGKTKIGPEIAIGRAARTVVVYVPSLALMRQTLPDWINAQFVGGTPDILCVCSDSSVAGDAPVVTAAELVAEFHKPVTSECKDVRHFLAKSSDRVRIVFSTYQSSDIVGAGCPAGFIFDMGLFDEAHRTAGKHSAFSAPLLDTHTPILKRVFMTATPKHFDVRRMKKDGEAKVVFSMDDENVYGRMAYSLPIREAINRKIIADYQILISVVDDSMITCKLSDMNIEGTDAELIAHSISIKDAMEKYGVKKVVTFHDSVLEAKQFSDNKVIQQQLGVQTFHVNGSIPTGERAKIMGQFATALQGVISNARCLTEGVDVPSIDMVAFLHPKKSKIDIIQAIGRALRLPHPGAGKTGYILLPIYASQVENGEFEKTLKAGGYDFIVQVLQALKEQDEVVEAIFRDAALPRPNGEPIDFKSITILGSAINLALLRKVISTQCFEYLINQWDVNFNRYKEIADREGCSKITVRSKTSDGFKVGVWSSTQKAYKNRLSPERIARLESLPGWSWNPFDDMWENNFNRYKEIADREGCSKITRRSKTSDDFAVGAWAVTQRMHKNRLSPERIARLESLPGWGWNPFDDMWENGFSHCKEIADREGCSKITQRLKASDGFAVGDWAAKQRRHKDRLSPERKIRLEALPGWYWTIKKIV